MRIKYAERDQVFQAATVTQTTNVPWGLDRIDSRSGLSGSYQYVNTGEGTSSTPSFVYVDEKDDVACVVVGTATTAKMTRHTLRS